jgi:hypothetical protein
MQILYGDTSDSFMDADALCMFSDTGALILQGDTSNLFIVLCSICLELGVKLRGNR